MRAHILRTLFLVAMYLALGFALAQASGCAVVQKAALSAAPHLARFGGCVVKCISSTPLEEPSADAKKVIP